MPRRRTIVAGVAEMSRTGLTLDERGDVRAFDAKTWLERRERLEKLGGPPRTE